LEIHLKAVFFILKSLKRVEDHRISAVHQTILILFCASQSFCTSFACY